MANIVYTFEGQVYLNITNRCPCRCVFCIRQNGDGLGSAETLWHHGDPTAEEVIAALREFDFTGYEEIVFCGYGEPLYALDTFLAACRVIREELHLRIRLNTNGLADLIHGKKTVPLIAPYVDIVSISLNAPNATRYNEVTRPAYGEPAFEAMLQFARECKEAGLAVKFSVVDVIPTEEIEACKTLAQSLGIPLRVREYVG